MGLPRNFYRPFDITYDEVTHRIARHSASIPDADRREWLNALVSGFSDERAKWPTNPLDSAPPTYREYMTLASRLRWRMLWLTACAYLHISYDLPRVLADEWPGTGRWAAGPNGNEAEAAFFLLRPIFPEVLRHLRHRPSVLGSTAFLAALVPGGAIGILSRWTTDLRASAWIHAQRLSACENRAYVEDKMMQAMTAALDHVQNSIPWSIDFLEPPDSAVLGTYLPTVALTSTQAVTSITIINILMLLANAYLVWSSFRTERLREVLTFIDEFGWRTDMYVGEAVQNPEELDGFLRRMAPPGVEFRK